MPVSVSVGTEVQFDTKNGYIPTPTTLFERYASQDGWPCLQNGACACNSYFNSPFVPLRLFPSFLFALSFHRGIAMGPIRVAARNFSSICRLGGFRSFFGGRFFR